MEIHNLPIDMIHELGNLVYVDTSIQREVHNAIDHANTVEEAQENINYAMENLINECRTTMLALCGKTASKN